MIKPEIELPPESEDILLPDSQQESQAPALLDVDENGNIILPHDKDSKEPAKVFNPRVGEFEWADKAMNQLHKLRKKLKGTNQDKLKLKEKIMKRGLDEVGMEHKDSTGKPTISAQDLGKTGDSLTGTKSKKAELIADSQLEDYKSTVTEQQWKKLEEWQKSRKKQVR